MTLLDILSVLASTLRLAIPLILAALGGLFSERAGVVALGLEGLMLAGAFAAGTVAALTGSPWLALVAAMAVSVGVALFHGFATIAQRGDQVVSGMALNILIGGLTAVLGLSWFDQGGMTPALGNAARFMPFVLPGAGALGPIWRVLVSGHNLLVYTTVLLLPVLVWLLYGTRFGLRLRAAGENPHAVDAAGLSLARLRYLALAICGAIAEGAGFTRDMTAGRGYLALAALIFGKWRPWPATGACLLFALTDALQLRLQGEALPGIGIVPVQFVEAMPYLLTIFLLAGFVGTARAPKALGRPFDKTR
jgi:general nucleoside transport system permease protein